MPMIKGLRQSLKKGLKLTGYSFLCLIYSVQSIAGAQAISITGLTKTTLNTQGIVTDITTRTIQGDNAFNSFSTFDVNQGKIVNLHVPGSAQNLLNIVHDKRSQINGILNGYKNGQIGGNVFFANPHGLIVGKSGQINTGSLTVSTPTQSFIDGFFDGEGNPSAMATQKLLNGNAPLNPNALVDIQGQISVQQAARIKAGYIELSGAINNIAPKQIVDFSEQDIAVGIKEINGDIILFASNDIEITGELHADGASNVDAGNIDVLSDGNIKLSENAKLTAKGKGANANGGNVVVFAGTDASINGNATLDASSIGTGDGGFVEFSAKKTVELAGGNLLASAEDGQAGKVLIDPENLTISADLLRNDAEGAGDGINWNAGSLALQADNKITVSTDIVISTRSVAGAGKAAHINDSSIANSGDLTLEAVEIEIQDGAKLLSFADGVFNAGDITLEATGNDVFAQNAFINIFNNAQILADSESGAAGDITIQSSAQASLLNALTPFIDAQELQTGIVINAATIRGNKLDIISNADGSSFLNGDGAVSEVGDSILGFLGALNPLAGIVLSNSTSEIILNGSNMTASGDITISSNAITQAKSITPSTVFGMVYGESNPDAIISLEDSTILNSGGDINISTNADSTMALTAFVFGTSVNAAFVYSGSDIKSKIDIDSSSSVTAGANTTLSALMSKSHDAQASAFTLPNGEISLSAALGFTNSDVSVTVDGHIIAADKIDITARSITDKNDVQASSTTGGFIAGAIQKAGNGSPLAEKLLGFAASVAPNTGINANLAGSFSYAEATNNATADVAGTLTTTGANGLGDINILATIEDNVKTSSDAGATSIDSSNPALTGAVTIGTFNNSANTTIKSAAEIDAAKDININSRVILPYEITWHQFNGVSDVTDKLNINGGVQNGFFTTWAGTTSQSAGKAVAGAVNVSTFNTDSIAFIDNAASINQHNDRLIDSSLTRDISIDSRSLVEAVNFAGSLSVGAESSGGLAFLGINYNTDTEAGIGGEVRLDGDSLAVKAENASHNVSIAIAGAGGKDAAVVGSTSLLTIDNTTKAYVDNNALITLNDGNVHVARFDPEKDGGFDPDEPWFLDSSENASIDNSDDHVSIANNGDYTTDDSLLIAAEDDSNIYNITGGIAGGVNAGFGASLSLNDISRNTQAFIADADNSGGASGAVTTDGNTLIAAHNLGDIYSYSLAGAGSTQVAGGGAVSNNLIMSSAESYIDNTNLTDATPTFHSKDLSVLALDSSYIEGVVAAVAASGQGAIGASVVVNTIATDIDAYIKNVENDDLESDVEIKAKNTGAILAVTDSIGVGVVALGGGAAISVNRIDNNTNAYVTGSNSELLVKNSVIDAVSEIDISAVSVAKAGSGGVGVGGSISSNYINNNVSSYISNGAMVTAENNIAVLATSDDRIVSSAGSLGLGLAGAGVGISFTINEISGDTQAYITGNATEVTALAKDENDMLEVNTGELDSDVNLAQQVDLDTYHALDFKSERQTKTTTGLAINAASSQHVEAIGVNVGVGALAVALIQNVNVISGSTKAYIRDASINDDLTDAVFSQVDINASNHAYVNSFIGNIAGGAAGVGVANDTTTLARNTLAYVDLATVKSIGEFNINALVTQGVSSLVVGGAGGIVGGAFAGTGVLAKFEGRTEAGLTDSTVDVGSLAIKADNDDGLYLVAGGAAGAMTGAASGSFSVGLNNTTTRAYIDGDTVRSNLSVSGDVSVIAGSDTTINNYAIGAAGAGGVGVAGAIVTNVVTSTTEAAIENTDLGGVADYAANTTVSAESQIDIRNRAGAGAAGLLGGVGAGAVVNVLKSRTKADVINSTLNTAGDLAVTADSSNHIDSVAIMVGAGGLGIGGGVSVNLVGDNLTEDANGEVDKNNNGTLSKVDSFTNADRFGALASVDDDVISSTEKNRLNDSTQGDVKDIANGDDVAQLQYQTSATISDSRVDTGSVTVSAKDLTKIKSLVGTSSGGIVGIGGAVSVASYKANVSALIDSDSDVLSVNDITVLASVENDGGDTIDIDTWAGSAGIIGLGAAVTHATINNSVNADMAGLIRVDTGSVTVTAQDSSNIDAKAQGAQGGAFTIGAVVSRAVKQSDVHASMSDSIMVKSGDVTLKAESRGKVYVETESSAAGSVASGVGADARAEDSSTVSAVTGTGTTFNLDDGKLSVLASASPQVEAKSEGVNVSLTTRVGVSNAFAKVNSDVDAYLADNNNITATDLSIAANITQNNGDETAKARSFAAGGGLLIGVDATYSEAKSTLNANSYIGSNSTLEISGQSTINSVINSEQSSQSDGHNGGLLALGFNESHALSDSNIRAFLDSNVTINGGDLNIYAGGSDRNYAQSLSGAGGVVGGASVESYTQTESDTQAYINSGSVLALNDLRIEAAHENNFDSKADAHFGSVFGGSGGYTNNNSVSGVSMTFRDNVEISADNIDVDLSNKVIKNQYGNNVVTGSGGVVDAPAAKSTSSIELDSRLTVGDNSRLAVEGDLREPGSLDMDIANTVLAKDTVKVDSGGVLLVAKGVSKVVNDINDMFITVGDSELSSVGDLTLATRNDTTVEANVRVKTSGLSGIPSGETLARVNAANKILTKSGATLSADGDIHLLAGQNKQGQLNKFRVDADTRGWNNSLIPVSQKPKADADLRQYNTVEIQNNASLKAVRDVHLISAKGNVSVDGDGVIKDVVLSEIATFFSKLFGGGSVSIEKTGGSSSNTSRSKVVNNGVVEAGTQNKQYLTIRSDGTIDVADPFGISDGITYTVSTEDLSNKLQQDVDLYTEYRDAFAGEFNDVAAAYQAEIDRLNVQIGALAGVNDTVDIISVDGIWAQSGNIEIASDSLIGTGILDAPGDSLIQIINHSPAFVETDWLTIPEHNGGAITLNGRRIASNADIGGSGANFSSIVTAAISSESLIHVENTYNPNAPGNDPNLLAPDLFVAGDILNLEGTIELYNAAGSVNINGNLLADTLDIQAGKDIVLSYVDGARHLGGAPQAILNEVVNTSEQNRVSRYLNLPLDSGGTIIAANNIYASAKILNINGLIQSGIADYSLGIAAIPEIYEDYQSESAGFNTLAWAQQDYQDKVDAGETPTAFYKVNNNSNITAFYNAAENRIELEEARVQGGYMQLFGQIISTGGGKLKVLDGYGRINVNNQSGLDLVVNALDAGVGVEGTIKITDTSFRNPADSTKPLTTIYKRLGDAIAVFDNQTVDQFGEANNLIRTGASGVSADNYSPQTNLSYSWSNKQTSDYTFTAALNFQDRTNGTEPSLNDTSYSTGEGDGFTVYRGSRYVASTLLGELDWFCLESTACNGVNIATYGPLFFGGDAADSTINGTSSRPNDNFVSVRNNSFGQLTWGRAGYFLDLQTIIVDDPNGVVLAVNDVPAEFANGQTYFYRANESTVVDHDWRLEGGVFGFGNDPRSPERRFIDRVDLFSKEYTTTTYHQHVVKADYGIDIEFGGYDSGLLNVQSVGDILINGSLNNRDALTHVESQGAIRQLSDTAVIAGQSINLLAQTGIGVDKAIRTRLNGGVIDINTTAGDINIVDKGDIFNFQRVTTADGNVSIHVDNILVGNDNTALIRGDTISLESDIGRIGRADALVNLDSGDNFLAGDGLSAQAATGIYVQEQSGDLLLVKAYADGGDVVINVPSGNILDANTSETRDTKTEQELLSLWQDMNLLGTVGVDEEANAADTITAFENTRNSDYKLYWSYRQLQANSNSYDAGFVVTIDAEERQVLLDQGFSSADVNGLQQQRTDRYHELHTDFGGLGNSFDSGYAYVTSAEERTELSAGSVWSLDQLTYGIAENVVSETTDTETRIEEANVKGINVQLTTSGGLGVSSGEIVIDTTPDVVTLTPEQQLALAAAESDDVTATDTEIRIALREDVDVEATGTTSITAANHVFLGSEVDINIDQLVAGQNVQIKTGQGIYNAATPGVVNITSANFILEAAGGNIGSSTAPIVLQGTLGSSLTARSDGEIYLEEVGDLKVNTLFAEGHIQLEANNIIDVLNTDDINLLSQSVHLIARESAGASDNYLDIRIDEGGLFSALVGTGGLYILAPDRALSLGRIETDGDTIIEVRNGDLIASDIISVQNSATGLLLKASGSVSLDGQVTVAGDININAANDISFNSVYARNSDVVVVAGANIMNSRVDNGIALKGDNLTLTAAAGLVGSNTRKIVGNSNGMVNIGAEEGIFYEERFGDLISESFTSTNGLIDINVAAGNGYFVDVSTNDNINIGVSGSLLDIDTARAAEGVFQVASEAGRLNMNNVFVKDRLVVNADNINLPNIQHTGSVDKLLLNLSGNDGGLADDISININSNVGSFYELFNTKNANLMSSSGNLDLTNFTVSGTSRIEMPGYSVVIYDGPPRLFPESDIQLVGGMPIDLLIRADSKLVLTDAIVIDYKPNYIINSFSTENSVNRLLEKRNSQQMKAGTQLMSAPKSFPWTTGITFETFFNERKGGTLIYDPDLLVQTETTDDVLNVAYY